MVSQKFPVISNHVTVILIYIKRLPQQQYGLLKAPLILAFSVCNSKTSSETPIFNYRIAISMIRCNFLQILKKSVQWVQSHLKSRKFMVALNPNHTPDYLGDWPIDLFPKIRSNTIQLSRNCDDLGDEKKTLCTFLNV